ncbi:MAG TPA: hypothetical protein VI316_02020 [Candidatus Dormibacteraeota bacterium]
MRIRPFLALGAAATASAALSLGAVHHASAHAIVHAGTLTVAIGWLHEPAYVGNDNAVQVLVTDAHGNPLTSITDTDLQVEVSLGAQKTAAQPLVPTFDSDTGLGLHGEYEYRIIPTAPGIYTFHVFGKIAGSTPLDQSITAGPSTFNEVVEQSAAQFPTKLPSTSELNQKVDAVSGRASAASSAAQTANTAAVAAQNSASDATSAANRALAVGIVALVLAVLLGGAGLFLGLRKRGG